MNIKVNNIRALTKVNELPIAIWSGGIKLNSNAINEPINPKPAIIIIPSFPPGIE